MFDKVIKYYNLRYLLLSVVKQLSVEEQVVNMGSVDLPAEVLEKIFNFLSPSQIPGVALVCRCGDIIQPL